MNLTEQYRQLHENPKRFRGGLYPRYLPLIADLVGKHAALTMLDYGSGKGAQYVELGQHAAWGILPMCYDPGYLPYSARPLQQFDGVICTGVAEHIAEVDVDAFLADVVGYARGFAFMQIGIAPSHKRLPDGRSVHLTVMSPSWWKERLQPLRLGVEIAVDFTGEKNETIEHVRL
jgi:hypothetical protein